MASEFYKLGFSFGQQVASACTKELKNAERSELAKMAGAKIRMLLSANENGIHRTDTYQVGFFSGFLERADELRDI